MLKKTILGMLAAGTVTGTVMFLRQIVREFALADWVSSGQPTMAALAVTFGIVLIGVGSADLVRFFVRAATRS